MKYNQKKRATDCHLSLVKFPLKRKDSFLQSEYARKIKEVLKETPEIRTGKVETLKKAIWAGTYEIESEKIAEKMINESLLDIL